MGTIRNPKYPQKKWAYLTKQINALRTQSQKMENYKKWKADGDVRKPFMEFWELNRQISALRAERNQLIK